MVEQSSYRVGHKNSQWSNQNESELWVTSSATQFLRIRIPGKTGNTVQGTVGTGAVVPINSKLVIIFKSQL